MIVEKLNQTRASAVSASSQKRVNMSMSTSSKQSPFKQRKEPVVSATSQKKSGKNFFDQEDLNDRIEFDGSFKERKEAD